jgi:hypothetical protein
MNLEKIKAIAQSLDAGTVQSFVHAARLAVEAIINEADQVAATATPDKVDYATADHDRSSPAGGWIVPDELRHAGQAMVEAISAEKWVDGFVTAVKAMALIAAAA